MSVPNSATRQPTPYSPLRALVARHPAVAFLVLAFWFGWTSLIPILLSENGFGLLPIELPLTVIQTLATVLGLALPAFLVTAATGGKEAVRDLLAACCGGGSDSIGTSSSSSGSPWASCSRRSFCTGRHRSRRSPGTGGCSSACSCLASSCPSCTPTCGRSSDGRVSYSQRCRRGAGPCLRA